MSTKIYDGLKFHNTDIETVSRKISKIKHIFENYALENIHRVFSGKYYQHLDGQSTSDKQKTCIEAIREDFAKEIENIKSGYRSPDYDFSFSIVLKQLGNHVYGYLFYEKYNFKELFSKHLKVSEFNYFDNTDRPKNISKKNWKKRECTWKKLIDKYSFKKSGFIEFHIVTLNDTIVDEFSFEKLVESNIEKRKNKFSISETANHLLVEHRNNGKEITLSYYMQLLDEVEAGKHDVLRDYYAQFFEESMFTVNADNFTTLKSIDLDKKKNE